MRLATDGTLRLSPSDLANYLACPHLTTQSGVGSRTAHQPRTGCRAVPRLHRHTVTLLQPLEDELRRLPDGDGRDDVRQALQAVAQGRAEVEKAVTSAPKTRAN